MTFSKALNHVIPQPLSRHQSCAVGNKIYVFGGFDGVSRFNEMSVFNVAMNWWYKVETRGDVPAPRSNHACAVVGTNMYVHDDVYILMTNADLRAVICSVATTHRPKDVIACSMIFTVLTR
jgi:N-acetylneuraminic acid mutarotase